MGMRACRFRRFTRPSQKNSDCQSRLEMGMELRFPSMPSMPVEYFLPKSVNPYSALWQLEQLWVESRERMGS